MVSGPTAAKRGVEVGMAGGPRRRAGHGLGGHGRGGGLQGPGVAVAVRGIDQAGLDQLQDVAELGVVLRQQGVGGGDRHGRDAHVLGGELEQAMIHAVVAEEDDRALRPQPAFQQGAGDPLDAIQGLAVGDPPPISRGVLRVPFRQEGAVRSGGCPPAQEHAHAARIGTQLVLRAHHQAAAGEGPGLDGDGGEAERLEGRLHVYQVRRSGCASVLKTTLSRSSVFVRREEQVEVLERLGQEVARHQVALLLGHDVLQRRVAGVGAAVGDERLEEGPAHLQVPRVVRVAGRGSRPTR